jgi:c-di-GMP-binding flagellar brake protein YcgR
MTDKTSPPTLNYVRRYLRISTNISVRVFHGAKHTAGRGHDIGAGGMAIYVPSELPVGSSVNIAFQLPCSRMVLGVRAIIRNSNGFRYGVEFVDLTSAEAEEIKRIAKELTAEP